MATKATPGKGEMFEFPGSDRNVYAEYLHATYVRKTRMRFFLAGLLFAAIAGSFVFFLAHGADTGSNPGYHPSPRAKFNQAMMPIVAPFGAVFFPVLALLFLVPLSCAGCRFKGFLWARVYGALCKRDHREKFAKAYKSYFDSFERYPMQAAVGERSVRVTEPDGRTWTLALRNVRRAYRSRGLVVLESGAELPSSRTVILDASGMGRAERRRFYRFLDRRLPVDSHCKTYYMRTGGPAVGEVVPDGEQPRMGKSKGEPDE